MTKSVGATYLRQKIKTSKMGWPDIWKTIDQTLYELNGQQQYEHTYMYVNCHEVKRQLLLKTKTNKLLSSATCEKGKIIL